SDSRSPCPWINALSNHGYLPRDGRNITVQAMSKAVEGTFQVFNVLAATVALSTKLALACSKQPTTFDLEDTALHGCFEHDTSISRGDAALGDNLTFNGTLYKTLAEKNPGKDFYDTEVAGKVMKDRLGFSLATNNATVNTVKEFTLRSTEAALYLAVMGDGKTGKAPKKFVDIIFREDRLPWAEGWRRSLKPINPETIQALIPRIQASAEWSESGGSYAGALPIVFG
ncbi:Cloroperoxidase, partial [Marasmius fiardii PR-910]